MKFKTTDKELSTVYNLYTVGFCQLQLNLQYFEPLLYTWSNKNGWKADIYKIEIEPCKYIYIATGYVPPKTNKKLSNEFCRNMEKIALDCINEDYSIYTIQECFLNSLKNEIHKIEHNYYKDDESRKSYILSRAMGNFEN